MENFHLKIDRTGKEQEFLVLSMKNEREKKGKFS